MAQRAGTSIVHAAILGLFAQAAWAQNTSSPDYQAGYEAGYKAAMEALQAGASTTPVSPQGAAVAPAASARSTSATGEPTDWWNHSALMYRSLVPEWRHHAEAQFSASDLNGNDSGYALRGSGKWFSRRNRWSNELIVSLDKRHIVQPGDAINQRDYKMLQDSLRYDLTPKLYTAAGFIMERDDVNDIDRRTTVLGGFGYYLVDNRTVRLNVFLGLGWLEESYLDPVPSLVGIDGRNSGLLYLYQTFDWQLSKNWSLQQGYRQIRDLDDSGHYVPATSGPTPYTADRMVKRYRNVSNLSLNYQLSPRSALSLGIETRYDSNPWPDTLPRDTTKRLSLNIMY